MKTLGELKKIYARSPRMLAAIAKAIYYYGDSYAHTCIVSGLPSTDKRSNIYKTARSQNCDILDLFPGAALRYKSQGFKNVVVLKPLDL